MAAPTSAGTWATCSICGGAVPPATSMCPTCGQHRAIEEREIPQLRPRLRNRMRFLKVVRVVLVVAVIAGIGYDLGTTLLAGPTTFPDPLTTQGTLNVSAGNFTYFSGAITGEDYINGNFTVTYPVGVPIEFLVYNSTSFNAFVNGQPATPQFSSTNVTSSRIVFAAPYTDTFSFVFLNPYPSSSGINVKIYESTTYETNVVID
ncbi:MAG: hypothetical protein L3K17_02510 [Thermoplasmata archaeon]|nr:hypothetical protein [Thermoplasmata archaeon]